MVYVRTKLKLKTDIEMIVRDFSQHRMNKNDQSKFDMWLIINISLISDLLLYFIFWLLCLYRMYKSNINITFFFFVFQFTHFSNNLNSNLPVVS